MARATGVAGEVGARIIVIASEQAYDPSANLLDNAQTEAAQEMFTKSLAKHPAQQGLRINAVVTMAG